MKKLLIFTLTLLLTTTSAASGKYYGGCPKPSCDNPPIQKCQRTAVRRTVTRTCSYPTDCYQKRPCAKPKSCCAKCQRGPKLEEMIRILRADCVQVIVIGNTFRLILGVDRFFRPQCATQIYPIRARTLYNVAYFIHLYGDPCIVISGHTDIVGPDEVKLEFSRTQANTIASYLWSYKVPLERTTILGCGDTHPVATNGTPNGSAANRRVEITNTAYPDE